jgi:hypothetical protein
MAVVHERDIAGRRDDRGDVRSRSSLAEKYQEPSLYPLPRLWALTGYHARAHDRRSGRSGSCCRR